MGLDSIDGPNAALLLEHLTSAARSRPTPVVVAASRRPLRAQPGWAEAATLVTLPVPAWPDAAVSRLAGALGVEDPASRELVVRLSAGSPWSPSACARSLHARHPAAVPAAMADEAVGEILARLRREGPRQPGMEALGTLASVGQSDEELLEQLAGAAGAEAFAALGALSVVAPSRHGLVVLEPYRTLFDLAHQWRHPIAHRTALTRAAAHSRRLLAAARDETTRTELTRHCLFLTGDPLIREQLFPTAAPTAPVRPMAAGEEEAVARLVHDWARRRNLRRLGDGLTAIARHLWELSPEAAAP